MTGCHIFKASYIRKRLPTRTKEKRRHGEADLLQRAAAGKNLLNLTCHLSAMSSRVPGIGCGVTLSTRP